jgi:hypothetical protein
MPGVRRTTPVLWGVDQECVVSIAVIRDVVQTLFFAIVATVTVLTYRRAKKTLLQPIRTEIFKAQLVEFTAILAMLGGKGEVELRKDWGFQEFETANAVAMYDAYAYTFFDATFDADKRPYNPADCPVSIMSAEHLTRADEYVRSDVKTPTERPQRDPRVRAAQWAVYKHDHIRVPKEMVAAQDRLNKILESPLLPQQCVKELKQFQETVNANVGRFGQILTDAAQEMPTKYPTLDTMSHASFAWIQNRYSAEFQHLKDKADGVVSYIRNYYDVESVVE